MSTQTDQQATGGFKMPNVPPTGDEFNDVTPDTNEVKFISGLDLLNLNTEFIPMLFGDLIPQVGVWALVGASDTGKSMALRQLAMCVVGDEPFLDMKCNAIHKRAIIVCTEDDDFSTSYLLRRQNKSVGLTDEQAKNIQFLFDTEKLIENIEKELSETPADLVIIDAFGDVFDGKDLNQNNQVRGFLNKFTQLANKYKCSIGFLHHTGKRTEGLAPSKNNAIGSQGFEAKMRVVIELRSDPNSPDLRHFCVVKGNYIPQEMKNSSIVIRMDDNLTFSDTGERVEYKNLLDGATGRQEKIDPSDMGEDQHLSCIRTLFVNDKKQFSQNELVRKLEHYWTRSDKIARRFVDYYEAQKWIVDVSDNPKRRSYRINVAC